MTGSGLGDILCWGSRRGRGRTGLGVSRRLLKIWDEREDAVFGNGRRQTSPLKQVSDEDGKPCTEVCIPTD